MAILSALLKIRANVAGMGDVQKLGKAIDATEEASSSLRKSFKGLAEIMAVGVVGAVVGNLLEAGQAAQGTTVRIKALATQYGEVAKLEQLAANAAVKFGLGSTEARNAVADLYGRLRPMGTSLKEIETVFFGVNKAAKVAGLGAADVSGVMLQLSQALGSGRLQGDELRSIMERMPAVGQAVAKVMGVSAAEIKKLGSQGKITTDVMIKAAAVLNQVKAPPPTSMQQYTQAMENLRTELGENLVPIMTPLIIALTGLVEAFASLPEFVQTGVVAVALLTAGLLALAAAITVLGPGIKALTVALAGMSIGAKIAGIATVIQLVFSGLLAWMTTTLLPALLAFFSGPAGWITLAIIAVAGMAIAFRKPLMQFWEWLKGRGEQIGKFFQDLWQKASDIGVSAFRSLGNTVKAVFRNMLQFIADRINFVGNMINILIRAYNRLPAPDLPLVPQLQVPRFARGGFVDRPTLGVFGDGRRGEYLVPEEQAAAFASNILAGRTGAAALAPTAPTAPAATAATPPTIQITTGPVIEFNGARYVTVEDLDQATRTTAAAVLGQLRRPAARRALGIG